MRRLSVLFVFVLLLAACGDAVSRELPLADVSTDSLPTVTTTVSSAVVAEPIGASVVETADDLACRDLDDALVGPDNIVLSDNGDEVTATLIRVLSAVDMDAGVAFRESLEPDSLATNNEFFFKLFMRIDASTFATCAIPAMAAILLLTTSPTQIKFCPVDDPLDVENCEATELVFPTELPCFEPTGEPYSLFHYSHNAIDCETGERVQWSGAGSGAWVPYVDPAVRFAEIEAANS